jgi:hypothetical protein
VVRVIGAGGVYLMAGGQRHSAGPVLPGTYTVYGTLDGADSAELGQVSVAVGETATFRCGFGACKQTY